MTNVRWFQPHQHAVRLSKSHACYTVSSGANCTTSEHAESWTVASAHLEQWTLKGLTSKCMIQHGRSTWTCSCDSCLDSSHFLFLLIPRESFRCQHSIGTEQVSGGLRPPEQPQGHEGLQGHEGPSQGVTWMVQNRAFPMKALLRVQTSLHPYQKNSYDSYDHHGKLEFQVWGRRCWSSLHLGS